MPPINNVLEPPTKKAAKTARERKDYLDHLNERAAAGGHGVNLGDMTPEEICARLLD